MPIERRTLGWSALGVGLVMLALLVRVEALNPASLWLDDAWLVVGARGENLLESFRAVISAPGYALVLFGWLAVAGTGELRAQLPALSFALASVPLAMAVARRLGASPAIAGVSGAIIAAHTTHRILSVRAKHYTLDVLLALVLLVLAIALLQRLSSADESPGPALPLSAAWSLAAVALVATLASAMLVLTAGATILAISIALVQATPKQERTPRRLLALAMPGASFVAASAAWGLLVIRPNITAGVRGDHATHLLPLDDLGVALPRLGNAIVQNFSWFTTIPWWVVALVVATGWIVARRRGFAWFVLLAFPLIGAISLAALGQAPIGVARLDLHLLASFVAAAVLALCAAAEKLASWQANLKARLVPVAAVTVIGLLAAAAAATPVAYPRETVRPLVESLEQQRAAGDEVVVFSASRWTYGVYTSAPVSLVVDEAEGTGFRLEIDDPGVTLLRPMSGGRGRTDLALALARRPNRLWLLVSHGNDPDLDAITDALQSAGLSLTRTTRRPGARLTLWTR
ncbi:MAG: hypothetical protein ACI867_002258 [Glaciecola sp.]